MMVDVEALEEDMDLVNGDLVVGLTIHLAMSVKRGEGIDIQMRGLMLDMLGVLLTGILVGVDMEMLLYHEVLKEKD